MTLGMCSWCKVIYGKEAIGFKCVQVTYSKDVGGPDTFHACGGKIETYFVIGEL